MIKGKSYTFFVASTPGNLRKLVVPAYALLGVAGLAIVGMLTIVIGVGSYSRMLWKVGNYNAMRHELETVKQHSRDLQTTVNDTNQRLNSLQSLATEVAMTYGVLRYHPVAFDVTDNPVTPEDAFDQSVEQYTFLKKNAAAIAISAGGLRLLPSLALQIQATRLPYGRFLVISRTVSANALIRSAEKARSTLALTLRPIMAHRSMQLPMVS